MSIQRRNYQKECNNKIVNEEVVLPTEQTKQTEITEVTEVKDDGSPEKKCNVLSSLITPPDKSIIQEYDVLVLASGSKKGIIQLGVLHYLHTKHNINFNNINYFVGTSIGSIGCILLAIGYTPLEIFTQICINEMKFDINYNIFQILNTFGLSPNNPFFDEFVGKLIINKVGYIPTLKELFLNYKKHIVLVSHCITADNEMNGDGDTTYIDYKSFPDLLVIEAIKMSCNIPLVFGKYILNDKYYLDGGLSDSFPVIYADKNFTGKVLGICAESPGFSFTVKDNENLFKYVKTLLGISYRMNCSIARNYNSDKLHTIYLNVKEGGILNNMLSSNDKHRLFSTGYKTIEEMVEKSIYKEYKPPDKIQRKEKVKIE